MKKKAGLIRDSLRLVWQSAPGWAAANTAVSVLRSVSPLLILWLLKNVIDAITAAASQGTGEDGFSHVLLPVIALAVAWFLDEVLSDAGGYIRSRQATRFEDHMYGLLHAKSMSLDLINFEKPEYYDCLARASSEATWRPNNILSNIISFGRSLLSLILIAGLILTLDWVLVAALLAANVPGIWLRLHFAGVLYNFHREQTPEERKAAYFNWLLTGSRPAREIRLFGIGDYFRGLFRKSFLKQKEEELSIVKRRTVIELFSNLFKAAALLFTFVVIARQTIAREISIGEMAMFLAAFRQGMVYIREVMISVSGLYEDSLFIGDTFEFLNLREEIKAREPVETVTSLKEKITIDGLSFSYPGTTAPAVSKVSFEIKKGEVVAITGHNGAGKTTLAKLLCRLYDPEDGKISFDGTDIRNFDPGHYRKQLSVIFQDFMLYNLTAGENIAIGEEGDTVTEKLRFAARSAGIHELISGLPDGYDSKLGNLFRDSRELSWGEWQKLALARALYRDASVLILDEPSSALDARSEYEIFNRFREIVKGRTCVLITHRFTNVSLADRIFVMDRGRIAETGSHVQLMEKKGLYYSMYTMQNRFER